MGSAVLSFSRSSNYTTQSQYDSINWATNAAASFPANTIATAVSISIAKGLTSGTASARTCAIAILFRSNNEWHEIWSGSAYLEGSGGNGAVNFERMSIPSNLQKTFATYGVDEMRIDQTGDFSIRGHSGGSGTATFDYEVIPYTACGAPTVCKLDKALSTGENVTLSWSGATAGTANAVTGYEVQRAESVDGVSWGAWAALTVTTSSALSVAPPATCGNYYRYRVRTRGAAGSAYYSAWKTCANTLRRDHAPLEGFTDSPIIAGTTPVKALHMLELQERVNTLRAFYGLSAYAFSPIDARGIAGWTDHVEEIRTALDEIGKEHDAWIDIPVNRPRADVLEQLRAVVLAT